MIIKLKADKDCEYCKGTGEIQDDINHDCDCKIVDIDLSKKYIPGSILKRIVDKFRITAKNRVKEDYNRFITSMDINIMSVIEDWEIITAIGEQFHDRHMHISNGIYGIKNGLELNYLIKSTKHDEDYRVQITIFNSNVIEYRVKYLTYSE